MKIGVLALQGAFREHSSMIRKCDGTCDVREVRLPHELEALDGLIIPGGESTTISKLLFEYDFHAAIKEFASLKKPIFGTCAGAILLAERKDGETQDLLNLINIDITRNAYGRQVDSREVAIDLAFSNSTPFNAIFIRAPIISRIGPNVTPLGRYDHRVVLARQDAVLVSTFHPELTADDRVHTYFLDMVRNQA